VGDDNRDETEIKAGNYSPTLVFFDLESVVLFWLCALLGSFGGEAAKVFETGTRRFFFGGVGRDFLLFEFDLVVRFLSGSTSGGIVIFEARIAGREISFAFFAGLTTGVGKFFFPLLCCFNGFADFVFDDVAGARINHAGVADDLRAEVLRWLGDAESGGRKCRDFFAVDDHGDDKVAVVHIEQVAGFEGGFELFD